jgi:hypothetical protein
MKKTAIKDLSLTSLGILCLVSLVFTGCSSSATTSAITSTSTTSAPASSVTPTGSPSTGTGQPVEVVSVKESTSQPVNPGGPVIEIVVKDVGPAVIGLAVTLDEGNPGGTGQPPSPHVTFSFSIASNHPLYPGDTAGSSATLIGGTWGENTKYTLTISGMLDSGEVFNFVWQPPAGGDYSSGSSG